MKNLQFCKYFSIFLMVILVLFFTTACDEVATEIKNDTLTSDMPAGAKAALEGSMSNYTVLAVVKATRPENFEPEGEIPSGSISGAEEAWCVKINFREGADAFGRGGTPKDTWGIIYNDGATWSAWWLYVPDSLLEAMGCN